MRELVIAVVVGIVCGAVCSVPVSAMILMLTNGPHENRRKLPRATVIRNDDPQHIRWDDWPLLDGRR